MNEKKALMQWEVKHSGRFLSGAMNVKMNVVLTCFKDLFLNITC